MGQNANRRFARNWENRHPACFLKAQAGCHMPLTFRIQLLLFCGFILLQAKGLYPGNADVLVGLGRPRHISCRRGRQRSQGDKGTDKNGTKTSNGSPQPRPPACESALRMEGEAVLSRKNTARTCLSWSHSCLSQPKAIRLLCTGIHARRHDSHACDRTGTII